MAKPISMNVVTQMHYPLMQLAIGISLACLLTLSGCSSGGGGNIHQSSSPEVGATEGGAAEISSASGVESMGQGVQDSHAAKSLPAHKEKRKSPGRRIYFADGDVGLSEESKTVLRQHAEYLKQNPKRLIVLRAYLDRFSSRAFSLAIAQERLNAVVEMLREQGVAKTRIRQVMLGQRVKKLACASPSCKNKAERIELLYQ